MDILLAHGYYLYDDPHERQVMKPYPPLGILYLSSYLKARGFSVGVFDATFAAPADFDVVIARKRPSIVGLYVNLMTKFNALRMISTAKAAGALVVLGGPEPPYYAREYLAHGADVIVRGEGETALEALIPHLIRVGLRDLDSIDGIAFRRDDGAIIETPPRAMMRDLSANPWPDREAIDIPAYLQTWKTHHGRSSISVIHARGCPYTCTWCSHSVYGNTHRRRTPDDAADELLWLRDHYQPDQVWYADDVFGINRRWLFEYAAALERRGVRLPFECISRADRLDEDVVKTLAAMGCYRVWNGSESGSQRLLDRMQRKVQADDVRAKTHLLRQHGIETGMFIMLGYDGEEPADLTETVEHLKAANPDLFLTTVAYPIKGTPYYADVEDRLLTDKRWEARTDRDLTVAGRRSRRYYAAATRWMVSEVARSRLARTPEASSVTESIAGTGLGTRARRVARIARHAASAWIGRAGMVMRAHERERVRPGWQHPAALDG